MVDTTDLKSVALAFRFESGRGHHLMKAYMANTFKLENLRVGDLIIHEPMRLRKLESAGGIVLVYVDTPYTKHPIKFSYDAIKKGVHMPLIGDTVIWEINFVGRRDDMARSGVVKTINFDHLVVIDDFSRKEMYIDAQWIKTIKPRKEV
jgi:hypothetical protein